jgi:hypothetical protein
MRHGKRPAHHIVVSLKVGGGPVVPQNRVHQGSYTDGTHLHEFFEGVDVFTAPQTRLKLFDYGAFYAEVNEFHSRTSAPTKIYLK